MNGGPGSGLSGDLMTHYYDYKIGMLNKRALLLFPGKIWMRYYWLIMSASTTVSSILYKI